MFYQQYRCSKLFLNIEDKTRLRIRPRIVEILKAYPQFYVYLMSDNPSWLPDEFGSPHWINTRAVHRLQMQYFGFWERYEDGSGS